MSNRKLIVVDIETTGLISGSHCPLEVAAVNVTTREELYFVPALPEGALDHADGIALTINRYFERRLYEQRLGWQATEGKWNELWAMLSGNTLGGSNPSFDADMMVCGYTAALMNCYAVGTLSGSPGPSWHYRLADLAAYSSAALRRSPTELAGLADVCEALGVENKDPHTAMGDARATAECFRVLMNIYAGRSM
ncbi:hypothetical protein A5677_17050 [Mycobacterium malmoense]|uniref:Exonuclease domain-containing protein n=1 Tax=Mycobacterium malmoense TaxID=1780 RepID=A0A1B9DAD4_MYCMA|nr:hypothetical protein [Mycobacterium malmoense]OCB57671.1 hypothetical protein A5677_17050 [Mycobacterium malmoense]